MFLQESGFHQLKEGANLDSWTQNVPWKKCWWAPRYNNTKLRAGDEARQTFSLWCSSANLHDLLEPDMASAWCTSKPDRVLPWIINTPQVQSEKSFSAWFLLDAPPINEPVGRCSGGRASTCKISPTQLSHVWIPQMNRVASQKKVVGWSFEDDTCNCPKLRWASVKSSPTPHPFNMREKNTWECQRWGSRTIMLHTKRAFHLWSCALKTQPGLKLLSQCRGRESTHVFRIDCCKSPVTWRTHGGETQQILAKTAKCKLHCLKDSWRMDKFEIPQIICDRGEYLTVAQPNLGDTLELCSGKGHF